MSKVAERLSQWPTRLSVGLNADFMIGSSVKWLCGGPGAAYLWVNPKQITQCVESAAGVSAGGRTGLTAVVIGVMFLCGLFLLPLAKMLPAFAVDGALIYVAMLMMASLAKIDWDDMTEFTPAILTTIMMPLTFSIANGIAVGFVSYTALKLCTGKASAISAGVWALTLIFIAKFIFLP